MLEAGKDKPALGVTFCAPAWSGLYSHLHLSTRSLFLVWVVTYKNMRTHSWEESVECSDVVIVTLELSDVSSLPAAAEKALKVRPAPLMRYPHPSHEICYPKWIAKCVTLICSDQVFPGCSVLCRDVQTSSTLRFVVLHLRIHTLIYTLICTQLHILFDNQHIDPHIWSEHLVHTYAHWIIHSHRHLDT